MTRTYRRFRLTLNAMKFCARTWTECGFVKPMVKILKSTALITVGLRSTQAHHACSTPLCKIKSELKSTVTKKTNTGKSLKGGRMAQRHS